MQDKNELLEFGGGERKKEKNLDYKVLATAYLGLFIALALFLPKPNLLHQSRNRRSKRQTRRLARRKQGASSKT